MDIRCGGYCGAELVGDAEIPPDGSIRLTQGCLLLSYLPRLPPGAALRENRRIASPSASEASKIGKMIAGAPRLHPNAIVQAKRAWIVFADTMHWMTGPDGERPVCGAYVKRLGIRAENSDD